MMLLSTNVGYSHSKAVGVKGQRVIIESVWGEIQEKIMSFSANGYNCQIETDAGAWLLGRDAMEHSRHPTRRQDRNWIETNEYVALHLYLITEMTTATYVNVDLVTGLPIDYFADRQRLAERLRGRHTVRRHKHSPSQVVEIETVTVLPEGISVALAEAIDDNGRVLDNSVANGHVGIIDIGGKTVNVSALKQLNPRTKQSASITDAGMWSVMNDVARRINKDYPGLNLHGHEMVDILKSGIIKYRGESIDVNDVILESINPFTSRVLGEASQVWGDATQLDSLLIAGGGAAIIGPVICKEHPHARVVSEPQFANVLGYLRYGKSQVVRNG